MSLPKVESIREQYEQLECGILSPFAVKARESKGRLREEPKDPVRTDFQRDRDRIIHSKSFRRLKHKTQVFIDPEEDHYRTRLTHTLEVAQIARTIARALRLNEDLTEAIALAHDLGHTPFGHAGEAAIDEVMREFVPGSHFHHSEQSLRVVDVLEKCGEGLNLTFEVRDGILHHSKGDSDLSLDTRGPSTLEGRVVKISDRIAYINHDIDDAIRAGIITEDDLPTDAVAVVGKVLSKRIGAMVEDVIEVGSRGLADGEKRPVIGMSEPFRRTTNQLKDFLFAVVYGKDVRGVADLREASERLKRLFRFYMEHPDQMGGGGWKSGVENTAELARRVCDFVSGMTDRYAQREYERRFANSSYLSSSF
ncbi:MAG: deoxyguanosinetriphosphate triphosphohydrolase [Armatimonadetes bacterium]|nr:deoxyguanosinetriphosphate triphosphohydrolase [Armatimonadota bacterium]